MAMMTTIVAAMMMMQSEKNFKGVMYMSNSSDVVFNYQRVVSPHPMRKLDAGFKTTGRVCLALRRPGKDRDKTKPATYRAAFSFCHPSDQFDKGVARRIASGRLHSSQPKNSFEFSMPGDASLVDVIKKAYELALDDTRVVGLSQDKKREIKFSPTWILEKFHAEDGQRSVFSPGFTYKK